MPSPRVASCRPAAHAAASSEEPVVCDTCGHQLHRPRVWERPPLAFLSLWADPTPQDGRVSELENVFIRGSKIRYIILPDMLKNAPMFKKQQVAKMVKKLGNCPLGYCLLTHYFAQGRGGGGRGGGRGAGRGGRVRSSFQSNSPRNWILTFIRVPRTPGKGSGATRAMIGSQDTPSTHFYHNILSSHKGENVRAI